MTSTEFRQTVADASLDRYERILCRTFAAPAAEVLLFETRGDQPGPTGLRELLERRRDLGATFGPPIAAPIAPLVVADTHRTDGAPAQLPGPPKPFRPSQRIEQPGARPDPAHDSAGAPAEVRAFARWPLTGGDGSVVGSMTVFDSDPRNWTVDELTELEELAAACSAELAERDLRRAGDRRDADARLSTLRADNRATVSRDLSRCLTLASTADTVERLAIELLGVDHAGLWLLHDADRVTYLPNPSLRWPLAESYEPMKLSVHNPIGAVIVRRRPLLFSGSRQQAAAFPQFDSLAYSDRGPQARAIVPVVTRSTPLGALTLVWSDNRDFDDYDRATIAELSVHAAEAVYRAQLLESRSHAASVLQRVLLSELPKIPGLDIVSAYRTAQRDGEVGGDWFDAMQLPDGRTALSVGDVCGHDIAAAATMGQLRGALRALSWAFQAGPASTVQQLDRSMADLGIHGLTTLLYAIVEPRCTPEAAARVLWTSAGHLPPLILAPDGSATFARTPRVDPPLGVVARHIRSNHLLDLEPGSTVFLYTDGLIERREEDLDIGMQRLARSVETRAGRPLHTLVDEVIDALVGSQPTDDVAVLAMHIVR